MEVGILVPNPASKYSFTKRDFGEEGNPILELAYALTVHKSQGQRILARLLLVLPKSVPPAIP